MMGKSEKIRACNTYGLFKTIGSKYLIKRLAVKRRREREFPAFIAIPIRNKGGTSNTNRKLFWMHENV